jgi:hypothetical protein
LIFFVAAAAAPPALPPLLLFLDFPPFLGILIDCNLETSGVLETCALIDDDRTLRGVPKG